MDAKLKTIVGRIHRSHLSDEEKGLMFRIISDALYATVWPTLIIHMSDEMLKDLFEHRERVTPDAFANLIRNAAEAHGIWDMVAAKMSIVLDETELTLNENKIALEQ